jgi:hypothetical protein
VRYSITSPITYRLGHNGTEGLSKVPWQRGNGLESEPKADALPNPLAYLIRIISDYVWPERGIKT